MKRMLVIAVTAAALLPVGAWAQSGTNKGKAPGPGQSEYAPGQKQTTPGTAKDYAPGQQDGTAKNSAPGQQPKSPNPTTKTK
jgi:hypothetical protein